MWTVKLSRQAAGFLEQLSGKHLRQVENALSLLRTEPTAGKPLRGELKGYWSLRTGVYRIIYLIKQREIIVEVLRIHRRKEVYEKIARL